MSRGRLPQFKAEKRSRRVGLKRSSQFESHDLRRASAYTPISVADSTKALTKAILGVAQGTFFVSPKGHERLRSLYHLRILHRDVSPDEYHDRWHGC
ncbi:BZ3500_MvSof-1268-A1-R1_Chr9g10545 [Microbotryum saponariae]|uniref:BZ3500_MvSof-1268-A1-R1_Chr9g10545 protein n=1 Tax=Microbotryum saponariae TaxID=289078 RepID=A0A2X0L163_9BASI|nr:BZ3501_MvSof-1269-A2-R1_Chr9g10294 [Microbotryum saponariae]SDA00271.1 BZ3500_MvSof-1268-A1-R1_Chr9g10545 [Microbotryum saponariae]